MKLKYHLEMVELGDEIVAVPINNSSSNFHGVIKVNETAKKILELLAEQTTVENVINTLVQTYAQTPREEIKAAVEDYIAELNQYGLLEE